MRESKSSQSSVHEQEMKNLRDTYKSQESELNELQVIMDEMNESRESMRNRILVCQEQGRGALLTIERLEREKSSNFGKIEHLKQLKLDFDKEITDLEPAIDEKLQIYKSKKEKFDDIEKKYQQTINYLDKTQNDRWELQRKISDDRSIYDRTVALVEDRSLEIKELQGIIIEQKDKIQNQLRSNTELDKKKKLVSSELSEVELLIESYEKTLSEFDNKKVSISEEQYNVNAMINSLGGQRDFYSELIESKEGFPEGTRFVLENPKIFNGILGTVADMFQVDDAYRDALESGLGDLSHCLIATDRVSAMKSLEIANKNSAGDLTVIPLKEASELTSDLKKVPLDDNIMDRASDLVKTSKQLRPLCEYLLGNLLVVKDLNLAIKNKGLQGWDLVDKDGAYSGHNLILKNRQFSEHGHMIGRQEKLKNISSELKALSSKKEQLKKALESVLNEINSTKQELDSQSIELNTLKKNYSELEVNVIRNQMLIKQYEENLHNHVESKKNAELELSQSNKALSSLKPIIDKTNKELDSFQKKVDEANAAMLSAREERDEFQNLLQNLKIKLIELEARRDQLRFKKTSGEETADELVARQEKIKTEVSELQTKRNELEVDSKETEKELELLNAKIQKQRSILDLKQSVYRETYQNIEELQARISSEQSDREQILEDLKNAEIEATETEQKIKIVEERIRDRYDKSIPKNLVVDSSEEQLELEIAKIQRSLENIGPVNMAVQDEHSEELERLQLLSTQRDDLLESEENLRETIRKIDKVARKRFQETFDLIKSNFESLFEMFFEGGNATLRLMGDPDPLEADIAIEAQPPGKRNTSLRLLSSGEKALTAISLLFSIYQVKPSPYCILDEVDAPLDDVNIHKFTRVLGKFCDETQFIIVTHNKLTMEIADYMYGVTQEKKGISKLVSVQFD